MLSRSLVAGVLLLGIAACGGDPAPGVPPSDDARALLKDMVDMASEREWEQLCSLSGGSGPQPSCMRAAEDLGADDFPMSVDVIGERVLEPEPPSLGGRVLSICVYAGDAAPIATEVLFISDANGPNGIVVQWPSFWEFRRYGEGGIAGTSVAISSPTAVGSPSAGACG